MKLNKFNNQSDNSGAEFDLKQLPTGTTLLITTQDRHYVLRKEKGRRVCIAGQPGLRPKAISATITIAETDGQILLKRGIPLAFVARGIGQTQTAQIRRIQILKCAPLVAPPPEVHAPAAARPSRHIHEGGVQSLPHPREPPIHGWTPYRAREAWGRRRLGH